MILSRSGQYTLLALLYLAEQEAGVQVPVARIAEALDAPANYLSKLLHRLAQAGLLQSTRGPRGGFSLAIAPQEISLADALEPVDSQRIEQRCLLGRPECRDDDPCAVHAEWQELAEHIGAFLRQTTLAGLSTRGASAGPARTAGGSERKRR